MHAHFRSDYEDFKKATRYPKIEYGITGIHVHPWRLVKLENPAARRLFRRCAEVFLRDRRDFFRRRKYGEATWEHVADAIRDDADIGRGAAGIEMRQALRRVQDDEKPHPPPTPLTDEQKAKMQRLAHDLQLALRRYRNSLDRLAKAMRGTRKRERI